MFTEKIKLESDEHIIITVRKHWFVVGIEVLGIVCGAFVPLILPVLAAILPIDLPTLSTPLFVSLYTMWLIIMWMMLFGIWTNYYLDVWTVTNKRLITVDQRGLFYRDTGSFRLERLQDINISIRGLLATFLKFGDLHAETASSDQDFVARGIPDPQGLKAIILGAADKTTFAERPAPNAPTATAPQQVNDGL